MSTPKWGWFGFRLGLRPARVFSGPRFDSVHLHQKNILFYLTPTTILYIILIMQLSIYSEVIRTIWKAIVKILIIPIVIVGCLSLLYWLSLY